jgi:hypothetical protein
MKQAKGPRIKINTWFWFGVIGAAFMAVSIVSFILGAIKGS